MNNEKYTITWWDGDIAGEHCSLIDTDDVSDQLEYLQYCGAESVKLFESETQKLLWDFGIINKKEK